MVFYVSLDSEQRLTYTPPPKKNAYKYTKIAFLKIRAENAPKLFFWPDQSIRVIPSME